MVSGNRVERVIQAQSADDRGVAVVSVIANYSGTNQTMRIIHWKSYKHNTFSGIILKQNFWETLSVGKRGGTEAVLSSGRRRTLVLEIMVLPSLP